MGTYIAKRVLQFIPVFLGVTIILFVLQNVVPGDPIRMITGGRDVPEQTEEIMRINNHLIQVDEDGNALRDENGDYIPYSYGVNLNYVKAPGPPRANSPMRTGAGTPCRR